MKLFNVIHPARFKGGILFLIFISIIYLFSGFEGADLTGNHFESRCDTLTRGTDTIVNCYVRCGNPPRTYDTTSPNGEFKYIEASLTWGTSIDTVRFQAQNKKTGTWYDVGVYDLSAASLPYSIPVYNTGAEQRRFRIGFPYPLKVRAILTAPASYSVRSVQVDWEGSGS